MAGDVDGRWSRAPMTASDMRESHDNIGYVLTIAVYVHSYYSHTSVIGHKSEFRSPDNPSVIQNDRNQLIKN